MNDFLHKLPALGAPGHQPALPQARQVGTHRRLRQPQVLGQIADSMFSEDQVLQDGQPGRVGQAVEQGSRDLQVATIGRTLNGSRYRHVTIVASCIVSVAWCSSGTGCPFRRARL